MRKLKVAVGRAVGGLYLRYLYRWWSRLYRLVWEYKYSTVPLQSYRSFDDLVAVIKTCTWKADGWRQLWDAFSYPGKVQHIINTKPPGERFIGDCEEFGLYLANVLEQSSTIGGFENGRFVLEPYREAVVDRARILTVMWVNKDGKFGGHNVCAIDWFFPGVQSYSYMDYGYPSQGRLTLGDVVNDVMNRYAPGGTCIGWAIHDKNLNFEQASWS